MGGKTSFAMLSAFESASHSKQVFFHSKHVVAIGENHPAVSSLFSGVGGWEGEEGGDICIIMTDLLCCMAETNTILYNNFPPNKK